MGLLDECRTIIRMVGRGVVRAFGGGAQPVNRRDLSRAERKAAGNAFTSQQRKEDAVGCGVFVLLLALLLALFVVQARGSDGADKKVVTLSADDPVELRKALFSGPPWLVECTSDAPDTPLGALVDQSLLPTGVRAARIDCTRPLPSGRTMLQRFFGSKGASAAAPPLLLAVGGQPPIVIDRKHKKQPADLALAVRQLAKPKVHAVTRTRELHRCARLSVCVLLVASGGASKERSVLESVAREQRAAGFAQLDRTAHEPSFAAQLPQTDRPVVLALRLRARPGETATASARALKGDLSASSLRAFLARVTSGEDALKPLKGPLRVRAEDAAAAADDGADDQAAETETVL